MVGWMIARLCLLLPGLVLGLLVVFDYDLILFLWLVDGSCLLARTVS